MKLLLLYSLLLLLAWQTCSIKKVTPVAKTEPAETIKDTMSFSSQVQPILVKNCSPCHFTGGKMYERMPFDKDTTIINHEAGILKRIKNEEENAIIRSFIQRNKNLR